MVTHIDLVQNWLEELKQKVPTGRQRRPRVSRERYRCAALAYNALVPLLRWCGGFAPAGYVGGLACSGSGSDDG